MPFRKTRAPMLGAILAVSVVFGLTGSPPVSAEPQLPAKPSVPLVTAVDGIEVVVHDLSRSKEFFQALGFVGDDEEQLSGVAPCPATLARTIRSIGKSWSAQSTAAPSPARPPRL